MLLREELSATSNDGRFIPAYAEKCKLLCRQYSITTTITRATRIAFPPQQSRLGVVSLLSPAKQLHKNLLPIFRPKLERTRSIVIESFRDLGANGRHATLDPCKNEPLDIAPHLNKLNLVVIGEGVPPLTAVLPFEIGRLMTPDKDSCLGRQCRISLR